MQAVTTRPVYTLLLAAVIDILGCSEGVRKELVCLFYQAVNDDPNICHVLAVFRHEAHSVLPLFDNLIVAYVR